MNIITRAQWGARKPKGTPAKIATPSPELWLHHTAGRESGGSGMRQIQRFHQDGRGWNDIAYSFVVDPVLLKVYEGRGAGIRGGHTRGHNSVSHAVAVMGNFERTRESVELTNLLSALVAHGYRRGWWPDGFTGGHRQASGASTTCPGKYLLEAIPTINKNAKKLISPPPPPPAKDTEMVGIKLIRIDGGSTVWVCNGVELQKVGSAEAADQTWGTDWRGKVQDVPGTSILARLPRRDP